MIWYYIIGGVVVYGVCILAIARTLGHTGACAACDHTASAHEHLRPGTECGLCACGAYVSKP